MQLQDVQAEIAALKVHVLDLEELLNTSIENNQEFAKTKLIFHDLRETIQELEELKKNKGSVMTDHLVNWYE
jgi:hypothetical protein